jgi:hypothetical protein
MQRDGVGNGTNKKSFSQRLQISNWRMEVTRNKKSSSERSYIHRLQKRIKTIRPQGNILTSQWCKDVLLLLTISALSLANLCDLNRDVLLLITALA